MVSRPVRAAAASAARAHSAVTGSSPASPARYPRAAGVLNTSAGIARPSSSAASVQHRLGGPAGHQPFRRFGRERCREILRRTNLPGLVGWLGFRNQPCGPGLCSLSRWPDFSRLVPWLGLPSLPRWLDRVSLPPVVHGRYPWPKAVIVGIAFRNRDVTFGAFTLPTSC